MAYRHLQVVAPSQREASESHPGAKQSGCDSDDTIQVSPVDASYSQRARTPDAHADNAGRVGSGKPAGRGGKRAGKEQEEEKPERGSRRAGKAVDLSPVPPPERPKAEMPWGVEKVLAWGDYARRSQFKPSTRQDSKYYKASEAARQLIGRGVSEDLFLVIFLNWMKGVDTSLNPLPPEHLHSDSWPNYPVDLWVVNEHFEDELRKYKRAKGESLKGQRNEAGRRAAMSAANLPPPPLSPEKKAEIEAALASLKHPAPRQTKGAIA